MNSLFTRITVLIAFMAVSFGVNAQSINSTLNNRPNVTVGGEESFTVTLNPGSLSTFTSVKLAIVLANPSQSANIQLSLLNPQSSQYETLVFDGSGNSISQASFFFLVSPLSAKVTFTAPGTYSYTLQILDGSTNAPLATSNESVVVAPLSTPPTIYSDVNGDTLIKDVTSQYSVFTTPGDFAGTMVKVFFKMDPAQIGNATTEYFEPNPSPGHWTSISIPANGEFIFGPSTGFPLMATSSLFRVTYHTTGTYHSKLAIVRAASPNDTLASANEHVVVRDLVLPTISSTLPSYSPAITGTTLNYTVSTVANEYAGTNVRVFFKLANPAQASNLDLQYEATPGNYLPLAINGAGEGYFGPGAGFPLANATSNFKATANTAGTYTYKMSLYDVNTNDTLATATETLVVEDPVPVAPTISSTLPSFSPAFTGTTVDYVVTTVANDYANAPVRVFFKLANAAQASDITLQYEATPGNYLPLTINGAGEGSFGPAGGFPLADASSNFKATATAPGTYTYTMSLYNVNTNDTLATATESIVVVDYVDPTIESTLDGQTVNISVSTPYVVTTTAGSEAGTLVKGFFKLENPAQASDVNISYEVSAGVFAPLTLTNGTVSFGPNTGFPLADASTNFKVTFDAVGIYNYKLYLYEVATNDTLATSTESVTVVDPTPIVPSVSSNLDQRAGVTVFNEEAFTVTTVKNNAPDADVRIKITLDTPSQASNITLSFQNPANSNFESVSFDANGVAYAGNAAGFELANASYNFKILFDAAGTYSYTVALVDVSNNTELADNDESVVVVDNSSINENNAFISSTFPNPTEGIVTVQTKGSGMGTLDVYNLTGKKVMGKTINGSVSTVSLETLPAGIYVLKISQDGNAATIRVVKK